jgi:hypothetical protein
VVHVTRLGTHKKNSHTILVTECKGKIPLGNVGANGKIILICIGKYVSSITALNQFRTGSTSGLLYTLMSMWEFA